MWRGNRGPEPWKLKEKYDSSVVSVRSLTSLDVTHAGAHGLDLAADSTYSPKKNEDEDEAAMDHRLEAGSKANNRVTLSTHVWFYPRRVQVQK